MRTVLQASGVGMLAALLVLLLEWLVAVNWDATRQRHRLSRKGQDSPSFAQLVAQNTCRRAMCLSNFVLKATGARACCGNAEANGEGAGDEESVSLNNIK